MDCDKIMVLDHGTLKVSPFLNQPDLQHLGTRKFDEVWQRTR